MLARAQIDDVRISVNEFQPERQLRGSMETDGINPAANTGLPEAIGKGVSRHVASTSRTLIGNPAQGETVSHK